MFDEKRFICVWFGFRNWENKLPNWTYRRLHHQADPLPGEGVQVEGAVHPHQQRAGRVALARPQAPEQRAARHRPQAEVHADRAPVGARGPEPPPHHLLRLVAARGARGAALKKW